MAFKDTEDFISQAAKRESLYKWAPYGIAVLFILLSSQIARYTDIEPSPILIAVLVIGAYCVYKLSSRLLYNHSTSQTRFAQAFMYGTRAASFHYWVDEIRRMTAAKNGEAHENAGEGSPDAKALIEAYRNTISNYGIMHSTFSAGSASSFVDKIIAGTFAADWHAEHAKSEAQFADLVTELERHASSEAGWANRVLAELYANDRLPMADRTKAREYSEKAAQLDPCDSDPPQYLLHNAEFYSGSE